MKTRKRESQKSRRPGKSRKSASSQSDVVPALTAQEVAESRELRRLLEKASTVPATTPELRALQLLTRQTHFQSGAPDQTRPHGSAIDGSVLPGGFPPDQHRGGSGGHIAVADTPHVPSGAPSPSECAARVALSQSRVELLAPWTNWGIVDSTTIEYGTAVFPKMFFPTNPYEISSAIQQAEMDGVTVRAVGSGWSFSDAALPQPMAIPPIDAPAVLAQTPQAARDFGHAIRLDGCKASLQYLLPDLVRAGASVSTLCFVEAGVTLRELNEHLNSLQPPMALATMGGSDGQTLAGLLSTGAHGCDFDRPPLADHVRAIYLIGAGGKHYWIERASRGVTDAAKVQATFPCISPERCLYDEDTFNAAVVSMGSMGIIYAVIVDVVEQYALIQFNVWSTWEAVLAQNSQSLFDEAFDGASLNVPGLGNVNVPGGQPFDVSRSQFFQHFNWSKFPTARSLQVLVNPMKNDDGSHNCYVSIRFEVPLRSVPARLAVPSGVRSGAFPDAGEILTAIMNCPEFTIVIGDLIAGVIFQAAWTDVLRDISAVRSGRGISEGTLAIQLVETCERLGYSWAVRALIDLFYQKHAPVTQLPTPIPQVDVGFQVMTGGTATGTNFNRGEGTSMEAAFGLDEAMSYIDQLLDYFDGVVDLNYYPAGYLSLRSCGRTAALLGMQQFGRNDGGVPSQSTGTVELALLETVHAIEMIRMTELFALGSGGLLHWGESNGLMTAQNVKQGYAGLGKWQATQRLLGGKTFTNLFMTRCGLA